MDSAQTEKLFSAFLSSTGVTIDTRTIRGGEIFFALKGTQSDGNGFVQQALEKGAAFAVADDRSIAGTDERIFFVEDALATLQALAKRYRSTFTFPVFALTGSNGKTTTKELLFAVLSKKYRAHATRGNLNNHIGVPLTILSTPKDCTFAIIEMGANHQGEIASYCVYADPDHGLITNIGLAHLEGFGGPEGVKKGKAELFHYVMQKGGELFMQAVENKLQDVVEGYSHLHTYGSSGKAEISGTLLSEKDGLSVRINNNTEIHSKLIGGYNMANILAAASVGNYFGVSMADIKDAIEAYIPNNNRSELKEIDGNYFILDAYNANPSSMQAALMHFDTVVANQKIAILGDMRELGMYAEEEHQKILQLAEQIQLDLLVTIGPEFGKWRTVHALHFADSEAAKIWFDAQHFSGATILLKGSRGIALEKIIERDH